MSAPRIRRLVCLLLALVAVGLVAARIWWVNTELPAIPLEYYGEGEWVPLEGAYQDETSTEGTEGYSVMMTSLTGCSRLINSKQYNIFE